MKLLIMILALLALCAYSYIATDRDIMSPSVLLSTSFLFSALCAVYRYQVIRYMISYDTIVLILSCLTLTFVIDFAVHAVFERRGRVYVRGRAQISPMRPMGLLLIVTVTGLTVVCMYYEIRKIGGYGSSIAELMHNFRSNSGYSTNLETQLPQYVKFLMVFVTASSSVLVFDLIYFWKKLPALKKVFEIICFCLCCLTQLMTSARFGVATIMFSAVYLFFFYRHSGRVVIPEDIHRHILASPNQRDSSFTLYLKVGLFGVGVLFLFWAVRFLVGRTDESDFLTHITHYFGDSLVAFDSYLHRPYPYSDLNSSIWGKETFISLNNNLRKLGILDIDFYLIHKEFTEINGFSLGNTYTAFRDYHHDFGMAGVYLFHIIFSTIFSFLHELAKWQRSPFFTIVFSTIAYCVVIYPFNNSFFSTIISIGFLEKVFCLAVLYWLLFRRNRVLYAME